MARYELIPCVHSARATCGYNYGDRVEVEGAKAAARRAVQMIRASQGEIRRVYVVAPGAGVTYSDPLMTCSSGAPRSEAVRARESRTAHERRGFHNVVRCAVISKAFKRELTKKAPKRKRRR